MKIGKEDIKNRIFSKNRDRLITPEKLNTFANETVNLIQDESQRNAIKSMNEGYTIDQNQTDIGDR